MLPWTPGQVETMRVDITHEDVSRFVDVSGDDAPLHVDPSFARQHGFDGALVHGAFLVALVSRLIGTKLPGPAAVLERIDLSFKAPCYAPCGVVLEARVRQISEAVSSLVLDVTVHAGDGRLLAAGKTWHKLLTAIEPS
jgi:3-hydroxybutyryl-CoA dehydratase